MARSRAVRFGTLIGIATLALTGCLPYPIAPPTPPAPVPAPAPDVTVAPSPAPTTAPAPSTSTPSTELPAELSLNDSVPAGYLSGWSTDLVTGSQYTPTESNDFPIGPTIEVIDEAAQCAVWAYNGIGDSGSDDAALTADLISISLGEFEGASDIGTLWFESRSPAGRAVEFAIASTPENGVWAMRAYGSISSSQLVQVLCSDTSLEVDKMREIASTNLGVDFLAP